MLELESWLPNVASWSCTGAASLGCLPCGGDAVYATFRGVLSEIFFHVVKQACRARRGSRGTKFEGRHDCAVGFARMHVRAQRALERIQPIDLDFAKWSKICLARTQLEGMPPQAPTESRRARLLLA